MALNLVLFFAGLFMLYIGADLLVKGSARIALIAKISPIIVGLTIVAFGTSSPEFLVSFVAAMEGNIDVAIGNIVGSNIANIGLVLGLSTILRPILHLKDNVKKELYWMLLASLLFWIFSYNNLISPVEGIILFIGIIVFTLLLARQGLKERKSFSKEDIPHIETGWKAIDKLSAKLKIIVFALWSVLGILILGFGSKITIDAAVNIAAVLGVSQIIIGLTMVAFGTSLPELATGIISVIKKENELLIGNVIGSNIFNILAVAGPIAIFFPIPVSQRLIWFDFPVMIAFSVVLLVVLFFSNKIGRFTAFLLFASYIFYIGWVAFIKA
jgi:cation:H+ antiporter